MIENKLSPYKTEMKKRGFIFDEAKDGLINEKGQVAVEIVDPNEPIVHWYNLTLENDKYEIFYFHESLEDFV